MRSGSSASKLSGEFHNKSSFITVTSIILRVGFAVYAAAFSLNATIAGRAFFRTGRLRRFIGTIKILIRVYRKLAESATHEFSRLRLQLWNIARNANKLGNWCFGFMSRKFGAVISVALAQNGATWRRASCSRHIDGPSTRHLVVAGL